MFRKCAWLGVFVIGNDRDSGRVSVDDDSNNHRDTSLTGRIAAPASESGAPHAQSSTSTYTVIAQERSDRRDLPHGGRSRVASSSWICPRRRKATRFVVTILGPDGRTVGPVCL